MAGPGRWLGSIFVLSRIATLVRAGSPTSPGTSACDMGRRDRAGIAKRTMAGLSVAVVSFGASAFPLGAAGADQIASTQSQVQALQASITASATHIRDLTLAYEQANTRAAALDQQVQSDQVRLQQLRAQEDASRSALRQDAIVGYIGGDSANPLPGLGVKDPAVRAEYVQIAGGDLAGNLDKYRTEELAVAGAAARLTVAVHSSEAAASATAGARNLAEAEATSVQDQLQRIQGTLDQLIAVRQSQQAAAAASAAAAREARTVASYQPDPTQGLPVNNGLVTVVRSVVSPSPTPTAGGGSGGIWLQLRECESGNNYRENTGNGFYGAYQFSQSTWANLGYPGRPDLEPPAMQDAAAAKLQSEAGWGQWPACAAALGLR